ncbi:hypothetical protein ERJ75_000246200 [Trypanosoma vivax]|uniref:Uncharacterized protein n=1 Tax=Trypanosoma vivax (strain Y486) TaxID=1055687 RepID=G0U1S2_TRYVY|nr:hypothetical protein ERJ75_000246200 [Trypanosoma vivax]CCC50221.1 hypothetical protein, conserved in T. vivax [Trypanosoma vivax Y486]
MRFLLLAPLLVAAIAQANTHEGPVKDAACKIGYTFTQVSSLFETLDTIATRMRKNASELSNKAQVFPGPSPEVTSAQDAARKAYDVALTAESKVVAARREIFAFKRDKIDGEFKKRFYHNGDAGFNGMLDTCRTSIDKLKEYQKALDAVEENFQQLSDWSKKKMNDWDTIAKEVDPQLLNHGHQNDVFGPISKDFREFITSMRIELTTAVTHIQLAVPQLENAQVAVTTAAGKIINEKLDQCKTVLAHRQTNEAQTKEENNCLHLQTKIEKISQRKGDGEAEKTQAEGKSTAGASAGGRTTTVTALAVGNEVMDVTVESEDLIDLATQVSEPSNVERSKRVSTTNLALMIGIPVALLAIGIGAFLLVRRRHPQEKELA